MQDFPQEAFQARFDALYHDMVSKIRKQKTAEKLEAERQAEQDRKTKENLAQREPATLLQNLVGELVQQNLSGPPQRSDNMISLFTQTRTSKTAPTKQKLWSKHCKNTTTATSKTETRAQATAASKPTNEPTLQNHIPIPTSARTSTRANPENATGKAGEVGRSKPYESGVLQAHEERQCEGLAEFASF